MGQAKRRGDYEERKAQAIENRRRLAELLPELPDAMRSQIEKNPGEWARVLEPLLSQKG